MKFNCISMRILPMHCRNFSVWYRVLTIGSKSIVNCTRFSIRCAVAHCWSMLHKAFLVNFAVRDKLEYSCQCQWVNLYEYKNIDLTSQTEAQQISTHVLCNMQYFTDSETSRDGVTHDDSSVVRVKQRGTAWKINCVRTLRGCHYKHDSILKRLLFFIYLFFNLFYFIFIYLFYFILFYFISFYFFFWWGGNFLSCKATRQSEAILQNRIDMGSEHQFPNCQCHRKETNKSVNASCLLYPVGIDHSP